MSGDAGLALLDEVAQGKYRLGSFSSDSVSRAMQIIRGHPDFGSLELADASNIALAERYGTVVILTLDERHFRAVKGPGERPFRLLPADL